VAISLVDLKEFCNLFAGNKTAYGIHTYKKTKLEEGKKEEGRNVTKTETLTDQQYRDHLEGRKGLGIIPINGSNVCSFAVLDVDIYEKKTFMRYLSFIYDCHLPVVPFRSKSGGLHIYLFLKTGVAVNVIKNSMENIATLIGLPTETEIFPKQTSLIEGQVGNWINLPYYNAEQSETYLYNRKGGRTSFGEALQYIKSKLQTEQTLTQYLENLPLADGPPCLQHIYMLRETDFRNEYLFSLACFYKTKFGEDFESRILEANSHLKDPIEELELKRTIIATHNKKDYTYRCSQEPIASICNKRLCRIKQYGIGGSEISELDFGELTQFNSDPPYYEWIVNETVLRFYNEVEIMQQQRFRALCLRSLHIFPMRLQEKNWTRIINNALKNINITNISAEEDISPGAQFKENLIEFLVKRASAQNKQQVLLDRVYFDEESNSYIFKPNNLLTFLIQQKQFRYYGLTEIQVKLRELGGKPKRFFINKQSGAVRVWMLPFEGLKKFIDEERLEETTVSFEEEYDNEPF